MRAQAPSFAVGSWLLVAPLVLGHEQLGPVLCEVALGLLVCICALAAVAWPLARFAQVVPAGALALTSRVTGWGGAPAANELVCAVALGIALLGSMLPAPRRGPARAAA